MIYKKNNSSENRHRKDRKITGKKLPGNQRELFNNVLINKVVALIVGFFLSISR